MDAQIILLGYALLSNVAISVLPHEPAVIGAGAELGTWPTALIATAGTFGFAPPVDRRGDRITVDGKVDTVISRGEVLVEHDRYVGRKGRGRFVRRGLSQYLL